MNREDGAASAPWADELAAPWRRLGDQLTPMIGESGFCALMGRALRLAGPAAGPLAGCVASRPLTELFLSLTRAFGDIGPAGAAAAHQALLTTFTALLGSLIGEALTKQLLHTALDGASGQKHEQEQK